MQAIVDCSRKVVFYNNVYGITCVSSCDSWEAARSEYISQVEHSLAVAGEDKIVCSKRDMFRAEVDQMNAIDRACSLGVFELHLHLEKDSMLLLSGSAIHEPSTV